MNQHLIRTVIVEDMTSYMDTIALLLSEVAPDVLITGKASTLKEAERLILTLQPDLVLLDIQFEREGKTGYDLLEELDKLKRLNFQIIIITGHTESDYYARAYDFNVIHFLKKPLNKHKLSDAISRVRTQLTGHHLRLLTERIGREFSAFRSAAGSGKFSIEGIRYNEVVDVSDIVWIEASGRNSVFHLKGGKSLLSARSIGQMENQLSAQPQMIRIHRSKIINTEFVERYSLKERLIVLKDQVPNHYASKERFPEFLRIMGYGKEL